VKRKGEDKRQREKTTRDKKRNKETETEEARRKAKKEQKKRESEMSETQEVEQERQEETKEERKRRNKSDAGSTRMRPRDYEALNWIAEMRATTESDLGVLLGRLNPDPKRGGAALTVAGVRDVLRRWRKVGLVDVRLILAGGPKVVTLTPKGVELVAPGYRYQPPAWTTLQHTLEVGRVRLHLEGQFGARLTEWVTEHRWKIEHDAAVKAGRSVPDAEMVIDGERFGVEVELTPKTSARLRAKVLDLMQSDYAGSRYYCATPGIERAVELAIAEAEPLVVGMRPSPVKVRPLPSLAGEVAA
jgi:hypothetical protein